MRPLRDDNAVQTSFEEIVALLTLIAALLSWSNGIRWMAWILFAKAAFDAGCAIWFGIKSVAEDLRSRK